MKNSKRPTVVSSPEWRSMIAKGQTAAICKSTTVKREGGKVSFIASSANPDRYGDTINQSGWKLDNFKKNPVLLWAHSYSTPPVGRVGSLDTTGNLTANDITFTDEKAHKFGHEVGLMVKDGFLNAVSVGFLPLKWEARYSEEGEFLGYHFIEQELLELSVVPVPAHPEALLSGKGLIASKSLGQWAEVEADTPAALGYQHELRAMLKAAENIQTATEDAKGADDFTAMLKHLEAIAKNTSGNGGYSIRVGEAEVRAPTLREAKHLARTIGIGGISKADEADPEEDETPTDELPVADEEKAEESNDEEKGESVADEKSVGEDAAELNLLKAFGF